MKFCIGYIALFLSIANSFAMDCRFVELKDDLQNIQIAKSILIHKNVEEILPYYFFEITKAKRSREKAQLLYNELRLKVKSKNDLLILEIIHFASDKRVKRDELCELIDRYNKIIDSKK